MLNIARPALLKIGLKELMIRLLDILTIDVGPAL